jgi:hypothetical protein
VFGLLTLHLCIGLESQRSKTISKEDKTTYPKEGCTLSEEKKLLVLPFIENNKEKRSTRTKRQILDGFEVKPHQFKFLAFLVNFCPYRFDLNFIYLIKCISIAN